MRNYIYIQLVFLLFFAFSSCTINSSSEVEIKKTYYKSGKLHEVIPLVNGVVQGVKKEFYEDGSLRLEVPYDSGYVHGNVKYYYQSGKLYSLTPRSKGKIHGVVKKYYSSGELQSETTYENDELQPGLIEYEKSGRPIEIPEIKFTTFQTPRGVDKQVTLQISLSNPAKKIKYSQAVKYGDDSLSFSTIPSEGGVGRLSVILTKGSSIDQEILVRAEFVTQLMNRCIVEQKYRLFAKN